MGLNGGTSFLQLFLLFVVVNEGVDVVRTASLGADAFCSADENWFRIGSSKLLSSEVIFRKVNALIVEDFGSGHLHGAVHAISKVVLSESRI